MRLQRVLAIYLLKRMAKLEALFAEILICSN